MKIKEIVAIKQNLFFSDLNYGNTDDLESLTEVTSHVFIFLFYYPFFEKELFMS